MEGARCIAVGIICPQSEPLKSVDIKGERPSVLTLGIDVPLCMHSLQVI